MGGREHSPEFRRKGPDLLGAGRKVADVARDLLTSPESIYAWRRQDRIDRGGVRGPSNLEKSELAVAQLGAEIAVHRRACELHGAQRGEERIGERTDVDRGQQGDGAQSTFRQADIQDVDRVMHGSQSSLCRT